MRNNEELKYQARNYLKRWAIKALGMVLASLVFIGLLFFYFYASTFTYDMVVMLGAELVLIAFCGLFFLIYKACEFIYNNYLREQHLGLKAWWASWRLRRQ